VAFNSALEAGGDSGGGIFVGSATLYLTNTIVAANTALNSGLDIAGNVQSADRSLVGDGSGSNIASLNGGNLVGTSAQPIDPRLGVLRNNSGSTETLALLSGSPAIGNGDNAVAPAKDQRGHTRKDQRAGKPQETTDIGAFEL
jgi:hypothetical protein